MAAVGVAQAGSYSVTDDFETAWAGDYAPGWENAAYRHGEAPVGKMMEQVAGGFTGSGMKLIADSTPEDWMWWAGVEPTPASVNPGAMAKEYNPYMSAMYYDEGGTVGVDDSAGQIYNVPSWSNLYIGGTEDWTDIQFGARDNVEDNYYYVSCGEGMTGWGDTTVARTVGWHELKMQLLDSDGKVHFILDGTDVGTSHRDDYVDLGQTMGLYTRFAAPLSGWDPKPSTIWDDFSYGSDANASNTGLLDNLAGGASVDIVDFVGGGTGYGTAGITGPDLGGHTEVLGDAVTIDDLDAGDLGAGGFITLKMYYTQDELDALGIIESTLRPYWWSGSAWVLGGTTTGGAEGEGQWEGFVSEVGFGLGSYGLNMADNYVWSNINHASDYGQGGVTPVPGSVLMGAMGLGLVGWLKRRKSRKQEA